MSNKLLERFREYINTSQFNALKIGLASPEKIRSFIKVMDEAMQNYFDLGLVDQSGFEAALSLLGRPGVVVTNKKKAEEEIYGLRMPHLNPLIDVADGMTVEQFFNDKMPGRKPDDFLIRVNRQPAPRDHVLQENDRVTITPTKVEGAVT